MVLPRKTGPLHSAGGLHGDNSIEGERDRKASPLPIERYRGFGETEIGLQVGRRKNEGMEREASE